MPVSTLANVIEDDFSLTPSLNAGVLTVRFKGTAGTDAVPSLEAYLEALSRDLPELRLDEVVFDIRELNLLTSSALKALLGFVYRLTASSLPCRVRILVDARLGWQRRCLTALVRLAPHVAEIRDA